MREEQKLWTICGHGGQEKGRVDLPVYSSFFFRYLIFSIFQSTSPLGDDILIIYYKKQFCKH